MRYGGVFVSRHPLDGDRRGPGQGAEAKLALNDLCGLYWQPVYAFLRRKGNTPADSEDLTQGFFAELLSRGSLETVAEEKGRLRTFLLKAVIPRTNRVFLASA